MSTKTGIKRTPLKKGVAELPLHRGHAPRWLFNRMVKLSKSIIHLIINEYGTNEFLKRIADPFWFQAFSCVIGFDWHSSGTTTTSLGAIKVALNEVNGGIAIAGGKGSVALKTPDEIETYGEEMGLSTNTIEGLKTTSRITAKVDNSAIDDGYSLYHHTILFDGEGRYTVVQQGMSVEKRKARRYHWYNVNNFLNGDELIAGFKEMVVLNMTGEASEEARKASIDIINDGYIVKHKVEKLTLPSRHNIDIRVDLTKRDIAFFKRAYEYQPRTYEEFLLLKGAGPKKVRSLALISSIIYGTKLEWRDPVKYAFAHGGKDGIPYPVDKPTYDNNIKTLEEIVKNINVESHLKARALKSLHNLIDESYMKAQQK